MGNTYVKTGVVYSICDFFIMLYLGITLGANIGITQTTCLKQVSSSYSIMRAGPHYCGQFTVW